MLVRLMRSTSRTVLALALVSASVPAGAQQLARHAPPPRSLPEGADEGALDQRMVLPFPPPVVVELRDVTGSVSDPAPRADRAGIPTDSLPPALPFEDGPAGDEHEVVPAAPLAAKDPVIDPAPSAASPPPPAADIPPAAPLAVPTALPAPPAAAPAAIGTTASPVVPLVPAPAVAAAPGGLGADDLAKALDAFLADPLAGASVAQANDRRAQRQAIAAFYVAHGNTPVWIADGHFTRAARSAMGRLDHAAEDGLDMAHYAVPVPRDGETATLASAELALSEATVAYARQATGGRIDVGRLGGLIDLRPSVAEAGQVLGAVPNAADAGEALGAYNPPHPGYAALRDKLAELRQEPGGELQSRIPPGPVLKPGMKDARVPLIRARFGLDVASDEPGVPPLVYDTRVAAAVAAFQRTHGLPASGLLTARTIAALSGGNPVALENTIVANMELWRWLPRDLGPDRVEVNIPDFTARVVRDNEPVHETRVVVGQPDKPTPVFAQQMRFIIVNPYWNVPLSIIKKEMLPKLANDPNYFANHGYEVVERDGTTYVRQPPGDGNALGRIKFMFPNTHSVYLHDTNARSFFSRPMRALSHGCVRVEEPFSFAEAVMGPGNGWSEARIRKLIGGQERTINLPKPLPIFITYFTAFVDQQAGFQLRDDVYGYAAKVKTALGLEG